MVKYKMNPRTGDVLVWRSTNYYDLLGESIIMLKGLHSGLVLVSPRLEKYSACGPSPSHTYVTFLVDSLFPIEEVVGRIWHRPNGASLHYIKRIEGDDIPDDVAYNTFKEYISLEKRPLRDSVYISVVAFFRMGGVAPSSGHNNKRWNLCSMLIGYFLDRFGLLHPEAIQNNLLPLDFLELTFYQSKKYIRECIFDKGTYETSWLFAGLFMKLLPITPVPVHNPIVDRLLAGYDFPRNVSGDIKNKADKYLIANS